MGKKTGRHKSDRGDKSDRSLSLSHRSSSGGSSHRSGQRSHRKGTGSSKSYLTLTPRSRAEARLADGAVNGGGVTESALTSTYVGPQGNLTSNALRSKVFPGEGMYKGAMTAEGVREGMGAFFHVNGNRYQGERTRLLTRAPPPPHSSPSPCRLSR